MDLAKIRRTFANQQIEFQVALSKCNNMNLPKLHAELDEHCYEMRAALQNLDPSSRPSAPTTTTTPTTTPTKPQTGSRTMSGAAEATLAPVSTPSSQGRGSESKSIPSKKPLPTRTASGKKLTYGGASTIFRNSTGSSSKKRSIPIDSDSSSQASEVDLPIEDYSPSTKPASAPRAKKAAREKTAMQKDAEASWAAMEKSVEMEREKSTPASSSQRLGYSES